MKVLIQVLLLIWFIVASGLVLINGIALITGGDELELPPPPPPPDWKQFKGAALVNEAKVYEARVTAYEKEIAAIKAHASALCAPCLETYKAVAKDTIQPLLSTILAALLGYVFVKSAATVVNNQLLSKRTDEPLEKLNLP